MSKKKKKNLQVFGILSKILTFTQYVVYFQTLIVKLILLRYLYKKLVNPEGVMKRAACS